MTDNAAHPLLSQLADIQQPLTVSWWPPAPGWWLSSLFILLLISITVYLWRQHRKHRYAALAELARISNNFQQTENHCQLAMEINILLRRVALAKYPDSDAAALIGIDWLAFLNQYGNTSAYTLGCGALLVHAPYQRHTNFDADALIQLANHWIKRNT